MRPPVRALEPDPPAWVHDLLEGGTTEPLHDRAGLFDIVRREPFVRVTTRIPNAVLLNADELSEVVAGRYAGLGSLLSDLHKFPVRFWNYVPGIVDVLGPGMDRYMAFNRGRHAAYAAGWGGNEPHTSVVPTASAIGVAGQDLVIDCLASDTRGTPVDNPRQIAPWRYSPRYGPKPPCFARGTLISLEGRRVLLVAGTASIVGEESRHPGDIHGQMLEIVRNLEALILNAGVAARNPLQQLTDARIYVVRPEDIDPVELELRGRTGENVRVETSLARVCRAELLVEIEAVVAIR
jgi:chorismate lyase/3-hydroxybenzoate synthase